MQINLETKDVYYIRYITPTGESKENINEDDYVLGEDFVLLKVKIVRSRLERNVFGQIQCFFDVAVLPQVLPEWFSMMDYEVDEIIEDLDIEALLEKEEDAVFFNDEYID